MQKEKKKKKTQFEETKQAYKPKSDMAETLESLDREFKITINNMLRVLMVKVDNILE